MLMPGVGRSVCLFGLDPSERLSATPRHRSTHDSATSPEVGILAVCMSVCMYVCVCI